LTLSPLLLEKYLTAAEKIVDAAIVDEDSRQPPKKAFGASDFKCIRGGQFSGPGSFCLASEGEVFVTNTVVAPGEYRLRVLAYADQAGPEVAKMAVRLQGKEIQRYDVKAVESAPAHYEAKVRLEPRAYKIAAVFLNDYYNPKDPDPKNRDRNLYIQSIELIGPLDAPPPPLPRRTTHFISQPTATTTNQCLRTILDRFAQRAFCRPVKREELERLAGLAERSLRDGASFERSVKLALEAVLVSPYFLFRGEVKSDPNNPWRVQPADEYALASRLSYFLWSSMPDDELFALAEKRKLRKNLEAQTRRMIRDPKAHALVENFAGQWLQLRNLRLAAPIGRFLILTTNFGLRWEGDRTFFENILHQDRSILNSDSRLHVRQRAVGAPLRFAQRHRQRLSTGPLKGTPRGGCSPMPAC
jgi:hypothetical protein